MSGFNPEHKYFDCPECGERFYNLDDLIVYDEQGNAYRLTTHTGAISKYVPNKYLICELCQEDKEELEG